MTAHIQCRWFGGTAWPEQNAGCRRPGIKTEAGDLCSLHYDAAHMDPEDWTAEMMARQE